MYVLYVSFRSNIRSRTFGCVAMGSAVLFILSGFNVRLFCFVQAKRYVGMVVCISWLHLCV